MQRTEILPELILDTALFDTAAAGVAEFAPDLPFTWEQFTAPASWLLIPDEHGELSKAEMTLTNTAARTVRLNVWFRPDLRGGDGRPTPHNHPWRSFTGHVLAGGYTEDRYMLGGDRAISTGMGVLHEASSANRVGHDVYHEVRAVHAPGRTLSLMTCTEGKRGDWGYLDLDTGEQHRVQPVARFDEWFAALNPHLRG